MPDSQQQYNGAILCSGEGELAAQAKSLVSRSLACYHGKYGFSTASSQVYDTAWLAMINRSDNGRELWLFPECFHYLLRTQNPDGSWGVNDISQTAGILDSAAALLALMRHTAKPHQVQDYSQAELSGRIALASASLAQQLAAWTDIETTNHIGVELIIPALLRYLQEEDPSMSFRFPSEEMLSRMAAVKSARFRVDTLYEKRPSSAVHSLEAFVGRINFDRVSHHLHNGSMKLAVASPSSTAAYMMHATTWDAKAEAYLRHVVENGVGHGDGGVAGTYPIHFFEFNWVLATLLQAGFNAADFESSAIDGIVTVVKEGFAADRGVIGFGNIPLINLQGDYANIRSSAIDVDDTAKGLLALKLLDQHEGVSPDMMIKIFERDDGFTTFGDERDRSISSNCHVLKALLAWGELPKYASQIRKAVGFVAEAWWNCDGTFKDKWHLSHLYPTMLMIEAFSSLFKASEAEIDSPSRALPLDNGVVSKASIAVFQASMRILSEQREDGSWDGLSEPTAYAMLALAEAQQLCFLEDFVPRLQTSIERGAVFLRTCSARPLGKYWTSKTLYSVRTVSEAYTLAALKISMDTRTSSAGSRLGLAAHVPAMEKYRPLLKRTKVFRDMPDWRLNASLVESALFVPMIRARRLDFFQRDDGRLTSDEYYIDLLPATWITSSNRSGVLVSASFLCDMIFLSLINFQADEFIEAIADPAFTKDISTLHSLVDWTVDEVTKKPGNSNGLNGSKAGSPLSEHREVLDPLTRLASLVFDHSNVLRASVEDRASLEHEFRSFLHTQTTQMEDNAAFRRQPEGKGRIFATTRPFFDWVRTTAADHVSTAYSLAWAFCLISGSLGYGAALFSTPTEKYLAAALSRHLTTKQRMYNDLASTTRDIDECNLNSIHFPEFQTTTNDVAEKKSALKSMAEYEDRCVQYTFASLEKETLRAYATLPESSFERRKIAYIGLFCDVSSLFDQLYVLKDLSAQIRPDATP